MEIGSYCAYNVSLDVLLSEHVREAGEQLEPQQFLALLLNGPGINELSAVWLKRSNGAADWPRLFAFDVAYLDAELRILEAASVGPGTDFPLLREGVASVLFLSDGRLSETGSTRGNVIRICARAELAARIEPAYSSSGPREAHMQAQPLQNQPEASPPFDLPTRAGFAFEPFMGSLVYLPEPVSPRPQSSEYFLTREILDLAISEPVPETPQLQETEGGVAEPISLEANITEESTACEQAAVPPANQFPPALEEAIELIREQARHETEIQKERRKKKARTPGEKKTPAKRRASQSERRSIEWEQATSLEPPAAARPVPDPQPAGQADLTLRELPSIAEPIAEAAMKAAQHPPEIEQAMPEEAILPPIDQQIEEEPVVSVLEAAEEDVMPRPAPAEESPAEITWPESTRRTTRERKDRFSLARLLQRWLAGADTAPRRRSARVAVPGLVAFYWTGGAPTPHEIVNISKSGFYLRTKDIWLPDTLVRMTLEKPIPNTRNKKESIGVLARVVRIDTEGVGHEFVTTEDLRHIRTVHVLPKEGTSNKALKAFLGMR